MSPSTKLVAFNIFIMANMWFNNNTNEVDDNLPTNSSINDTTISDIILDDDILIGISIYLLIPVLLK